MRIISMCHHQIHLLCNFWQSKTDKSKRRIVCFGGKVLTDKKPARFLFRSIFNPTHHSLPFCLDFLLVRTDYVGKCCGGKLGWSDLSILCQKPRVRYYNTGPSQNLLCMRTEIKKSQKNLSDHHDVNKKLCLLGPWQWQQWRQW
jgi:hypothetical protein